MALFAPFQGGTVADAGMADDDGGFIRARLRLFDGGGEGLHVVRAGDEIDVQHLPVLRRKARADVLAEGDVRVALDGDVVVVIEQDEFPQPHGARKRARLVGDALFEAAVAAEHVSIMIDDG